MDTIKKLERACKASSNYRLVSTIIDLVHGGTDIFHLMKQSKSGLVSRDILSKCEDALLVKGTMQ
jgi:hypothetical protein